MILRRVLIANRGEIAVRVLRTCQRLGIEAVLAVSDTDTDAVPARLADQTIRIGPEGGAVSPAESYLNVEAVIAAAVAAGAEAIHPGYGFLSENPRLARACEAAGIVFIGPGADVLEAAGDKFAARRHAVAAGLPVLPGGLVGGGVPRGAGEMAGVGGVAEAGVGGAGRGWGWRGGRGWGGGRGQGSRADRVSGAGQGGGRRRGARAAGGAGAG